MVLINILIQIWLVCTTVTLLFPYHALNFLYKNIFWQNNPLNYDHFGTTTTFFRSKGWSFVIHWFDCTCS